MLLEGNQNTSDLLGVELCVPKLAQCVGAAHNLNSCGCAIGRISLITSDPFLIVFSGAEEAEEARNEKGAEPAPRSVNQGKSKSQPSARCMSANCYHPCLSCCWLLSGDTCTLSG